jgi:hypothetical protein
MKMWVVVCLASMCLPQSIYRDEKTVDTWSPPEVYSLPCSTLCVRHGFHAGLRTEGPLTVLLVANRGNGSGYSTMASNRPLVALDAIIPGSSVFTDFMLGLEIDLSAFISWIAVLDGIVVAGSYSFKFGYGNAINHFCCSVVVSDYDEVHNDVLAWASKHKNLGQGR